MKKLTLLTALLLITIKIHAQCACVWLDAAGVKRCQLYNCSNPNLASCANKVTSGTLCPCQLWPGMNWNCGGCLSNGACWYNGNACNADQVCTYISLPVELIKFNVSNIEDENIITWSTATEYNSAYFALLYSSDGETFTDMVHLSGQGNSTELSEYDVRHVDYEREINYYKLIQVDIDGQKTEYGPISIDNRDNIKLVRVINALGQEVDENAIGILFQIYSDGQVIKIFR